MPRTPKTPTDSLTPTLRAVAILAADTAALAFPPMTLEERSRKAADLRAKLDAVERAIADELPPLDPANARTLGDDPEIRDEINDWRGRMDYNTVDVSDFPDEDGDAWEIIRGSSRYEVREVSRYEARPGTLPGASAWDVYDYDEDGDADAEETCRVLGFVDEDGDTPIQFTEDQARAIAERMNADEADPERWIVWDTNDDEAIPSSGTDDCPSYDPEDEDDARTSAEQGNREDYQNSAHGWPFAHNYAVQIEERDADDFDRAGFIVATYKGGATYAGIDGGGYDFTGHHWAPLFFARMAGGYVRTRDGLRRIAGSR